MFQTFLRPHTSAWAAMFLALILSFSLPMIAAAADGNRQIDSGPFSITIRGGAENNSEALGADGRLDFLNPLVNLHAFGTVDMLNSGRGEGEIDNYRYGAGLALSHTFPKVANIFAGTSFIHEMNDSFGHAYVGGKLRVTDFALLSATYGFGFGSTKYITTPKNFYENFAPSSLNKIIAAKAADWLKVGAVLVDRQGLKANLYYYLTDPSHQDISGIEGEISYPLLDNLTIGINGSCDLTDNSVLERTWRSFVFVTYTFGGQKGSPIDVALDKNNPIEYPRIIRPAAVVGGLNLSTLTVTPTSATANGCSSQSVNFIASGGTPPYSWTTSDAPSNLKTFGPNRSSAIWQDFADLFCSGGGTVTVTVFDSTGARATATISVTSIPN